MDIRARLQEQLTSAIMNGFAQLGGDPLDAIRLAQTFATQEDWIKQETSKVALAGGAGALLPGMAALTLPAGIAYLLRKIATMSWGVGAHSGVYVLEGEPSSDLINILTLWVNENQPDTVLERRALHLSAFAYAQTTAGHAHLDTLLAHAPELGLDSTTRNTLTALRTVVDAYAESPQGYALVRAVAGKAAAEQALHDAQARLGDSAMRVRFNVANPGESLVKAVEGRMRITRALAEQIALQILLSLPLRVIITALPVVGALLNAVISAQFLQGVGDSAVRYYADALTADELRGLG